MDELLTVAQAARLLGASDKAVRRRIERGSLESVGRHGRRLVPRGALVAQPSPPRQRGSGARAELAEALRRVEELAGEVGRLRALTEEAKSLRGQAVEELHAARARATELDAWRAQLAAAGWRERRRMLREARAAGRMSSPTRARFGDHARRPIPQRRLSRDQVEAVVIPGHDQRTRNSGRADWRLRHRGIVVLYDWPDDGDPTSVLVRSAWRQ
jgi:hypothetical protein